MPSNHLILCRPVLPLPSISPSIRVFCNESSQFFTLGGQSIGASASASVLPMSSQGWFPIGIPLAQASVSFLWAADQGTLSLSLFLFLVVFPSILSLTSARVAIISGTHCTLCVLANRLLFFFFFWSFWPYIFLLQCLRIHCFFQLKQLPSLSDVSPWTRLTCPLSDLSYTVNALHTDLPVANFQRCQCAFHQHQVWVKLHTANDPSALPSPSSSPSSSR